VRPVARATALIEYMLLTIPSVKGIVRNKFAQVLYKT